MWLIRDGEKGEKEIMRWGEEGGYIPLATRMTLALRRAAMRAILMFY